MRGLKIMNRNEIVSILVNKHKVSEETLKGKRQGTLEEMLNNIEKANQVVEDLVPSGVEYENEQPEEAPNYRLKMCDAGWTKWCLTNLFDKSEIIDNAPKLDGLRRIARKIFGTINTYVNVEQVPTKENGNKTAVSVVVKAPDYGYEHAGIGDCTFFNTDLPYSNYPFAMAESRAEGRALKKLLGLSCSTFEEIGTTNVVKEKASDMMINAVKIAASNKKINLDQLIATEFENLEALELATTGQIQHILSIIKES